MANHVSMIRLDEVTLNCAAALHDELVETIFDDTYEPANKVRNAANYVANIFGQKEAREFAVEVWAIALTKIMDDFAEANRELGDDNPA